MYSFQMRWMSFEGVLYRFSIFIRLLEFYESISRTTCARNLFSADTDRISRLFRHTRIYSNEQESSAIHGRLHFHKTLTQIEAHFIQYFLIIS